MASSMTFQWQHGSLVLGDPSHMRRPRWRALVPVVGVAVFSLGGCQPRSDEPAFKAGASAPEQTEALRQMNEVGANAYRGHAWAFEWSGDCVLRIRHSYQGHLESLSDHSLAARKVEVVPYADGGFGVKAYLPKGGSTDLFDTPSDEHAKAFAQLAGRLAGSCKGPQI